MIDHKKNLKLGVDRTKAYSMVSTLVVDTKSLSLTDFESVKCSRTVVQHVYSCIRWTFWTTLCCMPMDYALYADTIGSSSGYNL